MFSSYRYDRMIDVVELYMWSSYICGRVIYVVELYMWSSYRCVRVIYVVELHLCSSYRCVRFIPRSMINLYMYVQLRKSFKVYYEHHVNDILISIYNTYRISGAAVRNAGLSSNKCCYTKRQINDRNYIELNDIFESPRVRVIVRLLYVQLQSIVSVVTGCIV